MEETITQLNEDADTVCGIDDELGNFETDPKKQHNEFIVYKKSNGEVYSEYKTLINRYFKYIDRKLREKYSIPSTHNIRYDDQIFMCTLFIENYNNSTIKNFRQTCEICLNHLQFHVL